MNRIRAILYASLTRDLSCPVYSVTNEQIVREMPSAGEADCRRCWVAIATAPDRRRVIGKQIAMEAAREGEAYYHRCQVATAMDMRRRLGVADRCRRQVATGRRKIGVADHG